MTEPPTLDAVSSQAMNRLAASRPPLTVAPAGEEAIRKSGRQWKRMLPWVFLALSVFALASMALSVTSLDEDGWSLSDGVQLALMALLVFGAVSQARGVLRTTKAGRGLASLRKSKALPVAPDFVVPPLDAVSAEYLAARNPATAAGMRRTVAVRRAGSRFFERAGVVFVLVLAVLAFLGMLFALAYIAYTAGLSDPGVWLTAPFAALTGFAGFQLFRSAGRTGFRGRPGTLISRGFRDSVRVWGSGSMVAKVAFTGAATASVAGAAVVPVVIDRNTDFDIFVRDTVTTTTYRIDLETDTSLVVDRRASPGFSAIGYATAQDPLTTSDGKKLPKGSLLMVLEFERRGAQTIVGFRPGQQTPVTISRVQPALTDAKFTAGPGALLAVKPDGSYWSVDLASGAATQIGSLQGAVGPMTYEAGSKTLLMFAGGEVIRMNPADGAVLNRNPLTLPEGGEACGIADGPEDRLFITLKGRAEILVYRTKSRASALLRPTGQPPTQPCELTVAVRK